MIWLWALGGIVALNAAGLAWCYGQQSDKLTDLIYNLSFFLLAVGLLLFGGDFSALKLGMTAMIGLWSLRLGIYLFVRIHHMDKDERFDEMRPEFSRIAGFWALQTVSIAILALPIIILFGKNAELNSFSYLGMGIWVLGWVLESLSDYQKFQFRKDSENDGQFVNVGLWVWLQHPNYLGEILCWLGVWLYTVPYLVGWEWLSVLSPIWISTLLIFISGIPLLEKAAEKKYGHLAAYRKYKENTYKLIPFIW